MVTKAKERIILGIDPGNVIMGYGIIEQKGNKIQCLTLGVIALSKYDDIFARLQIIYTRTLGLITAYKPDELAIEAPFYGKNVQSMLKLGRAQGVAMAAALHHNIPVFEYAPRKIKMAITGNGNASKEQVSAMLQKTIGITEIPENFDATDGLAAAVCHAYQPEIGGDSMTAKSWKEFINKNPGRIK